LPELDRLIQANANQTLASIQPRHEIKVLMKQIPMLASTSPQMLDDSALFFCQKVVNLLFKTDCQLGLEVYVTLLSKLCDLSKRVHKEVTTWLLYSNDDVRCVIPLFDRRMTFN
jgi:CCR4-NOT transcription complex subunit 1